MLRRQVIRHERRERAALDPPERPYEFSPFRETIDQDPLEDLAADVVDQRHLEGDERVVQNAPLSGFITQRPIVWQTAQREALVALVEPMPKERLRGVPVAHRPIVADDRGGVCRRVEDDPLEDASYC